MQNKRLSATTGELCPLKCTYCFASDPEYKSPVNLFEKVETLSSTIEDYQIIQPACDTEFLLDSIKAFNLLERLLKLKKDISFVTKMPIKKQNLSKLMELSDRYRQQGNLLSVSVTLTSIESSKIFEPIAPSPEVRIQTLRSLFENGIHTMVAIRPLIPSVPDSEIHEIVNKTVDLTFAYTSGPFWTKHPEGLSGNISEESVSWMSGDQKWFQVSDPDREIAIINYISSKGKLLYESSVDAILSTKKSYLERAKNVNSTSVKNLQTI